MDETLHALRGVDGYCPVSCVFRASSAASAFSNVVGRPADLAARVTAAKALAHAAIRRDFLPRKQRAAEVALLAGREFADAMLALLTLENDEADALGARHPDEMGTSLVLGGWAPTTDLRENILAHWARQARAAGLLPS